MKKEGKTRTDSTFPARMKKLRQENDLTQQQVADLLSLERSSIAKYELGQSSPNPETLLTMAKIYNVSVDYLIRGKSEEETSFTVYSGLPEYKTGSPLPLLNTQHMHDLTKDEQFLVLYFRMLDHDPEILEELRQKYKELSKNEDS